MLRWCFALVCATVVVVVVASEGHVNHTHQVRKERLRERWGMDNIIRDIDHVKEDLQSIIELTDNKQLSPDELAFYLLRMHDFDDNNRLDGIEIHVIGIHTMEHWESDISPDVREQRAAEIIDDVLKNDLDNDGFMDYGEFKALFNKRIRQHEEYHNEEY